MKQSLSELVQKRLLPKKVYVIIVVAFQHLASASKLLKALTSKSAKVHTKARAHLQQLLHGWLEMGVLTKKEYAVLPAFLIDIVGS